MKLFKLDDCDNLVQMAEKCMQNPKDKVGLVDKETVKIVLDEFPTFKETARIFWKDDFDRILSKKEEKEALQSYWRMYLYLYVNQDGCDILADTMVLVRLAAKMISRAYILKPLYSILM